MEEAEPAEVPPLLRAAHESWSARGSSPSFADLASTEDGFELAAALLDGPGGLEAPADDVFECTLYLGMSERAGGPPPAELFGAGAPESLAAEDVVLRDAWFRRDLPPAVLAPGAVLRDRCLPALRLGVVYEVPLAPEELARLRGAGGGLDQARFRRWLEDRCDLVGLLQWDLAPPLRRAVPGLLFFLLGWSLTRLELRAV